MATPSLSEKEPQGAGCGMTNGGIPIALPSIGVDVELPDCIRYRRDGRNEREGLAVDIALDKLPNGAWAANAALRALQEVRLP